MATEPLDAPNDSDVLERRRWSGSTKVYTRKNKGQRNRNDEPSKGTRIGDSVSRSEAREIDEKTLIVENRRVRQPEARGQADKPLRELPQEDCYKLGEDDEAGCVEVPVLADKEHLLVSKGVIVSSRNYDNGETLGEEIQVDQLGVEQEVCHSPGETAGQKSKELLVDGTRVEQEEGSRNNGEVTEDVKLSQEVGDSHGDAANQNCKDLLVDGKEVLLSSRNNNQSQHEDAPSQEEMVRPVSNDRLLESRQVSLMKENQLGQEAADSLGHEEGATYVEALPGSDDVIPENRAVLVSQEDSGRLGQGGGGSGGEIVRMSDVESLESREIVVQPYSSGCDIADGNGVMGQNKLPLELQQVPSVMTMVGDKIRINVSSARTSDEIRGVKRKLETELDQVRSLFKKLQAKELQVTASNCNTNTMNNGISNVETLSSNNILNGVNTYVGAAGNFDSYIQPQYALNDAAERTLTRVSSEVGSVFHRPNTLFSRSLSVSVVDNNLGVGEFVEREKRTPKANQLYRNSEFLLGKDRLPSESNKKLKSNGYGRKDGFGLAPDKNRERAFRSCSNLLQRLMKHNFGWVFNEPVDAKKLGLHDYHDIIKLPMDLGTIKTRLSLNYYKSPIEFAEDVRLVFHNAMTYNPKGHDVNVMAETLLKIFEERWAVIEMEYNPDWRYQMYQDAGLSTPNSRKIPATQFYTPVQVPASVHTPAHVQAPVYTSVTPVPQTRTSENSQLMTTSTTPSMKPPNHVGRTPALKKPKARDPNKRDMTYDEKQKLSLNLQSLPPEKLDAIVLIIKRRNSTLNQTNDEIEVDIDSVDAETLWELDRFVTNYKKSLSKNKRKAELALQTRAIQTTAMTNTIPGALEMQKETRIGEKDDLPAQVEQQGDRASRSSSSSSSSSDSGSSSSDSDSDSSSSCESDSGRSPRT